MVAGMVVALLMVAVSVYGHANQIVAGFALFLMAPGIVDFLYAQNTDLGNDARARQDRDSCPQRLSR